MKHKILFINDCNGYEGHNPYADLVEVSSSYTEDTLRQLEYKQVGVGRRGGSWKEIMEDGNIKYIKISSGRLSDYKDESLYDLKYKLVSEIIKTIIKKNKNYMKDLDNKIDNNQEKLIFAMDNGITNLIVGEDIEFIGEPKLKGSTMVYTVKFISDKALKYIKNEK